MDHLEAEGVVGDTDGIGAREVLAPDEGDED